MKFSEEKRRFILKHQSDLTLEELAQKMHCHWKEVYECYNEMFTNGEYLAYMKKAEEKRAQKKEHKKLFDLMWSRGEKNDDGYERGNFEQKNESDEE